MAKPKRVATEIFVLKSAHRWRRYAKESVERGDPKPEIFGLVRSLLISEYVVTNPSRAINLDCWARTVPGYRHQPEGLRDRTPALRLVHVELGTE